MRKILLLFFVICSTFIYAQNTCNPPKKELKIRVFGDSWAHFPVIYKAYDSALVQYGFPEYYSTGDWTVLISMNSEAFLNPLAKVIWQPQIEQDGKNGTPLMIISLLGNDIAFKIRKGSHLSDLNAPFQEAKLNMDTIFDFIHEKCPDMQILWMCYDFPNFVDPLIDFPWNPYGDLWRDHGEPSSSDINPFINYMAHLQDSLVKVWDRPYVHFVNNVGLMQYMYGQTTPLRVEPFGTYPPRSVPFPGGNEAYPSPYIAMGLGGIDTYHLSPQGYTFLASYQMRIFFMEQLRKDRDTTIQSLGGNYDGFVTQTGVTGNNTITVGKNEQEVAYKGIIAFNTDFIENDRIIKKASLFIRRQSGNYKSFWNTNFPSNFKLDIMSGSIGNESIEASDFNTATDMEDIACALGNTFRDDYSIRFDITGTALNYINKNGLTQFRLSITDTATGESLIHYYTGDTTTFEAPYLDIYYDTARIVSATKELKGETINIFPNPVESTLNISNLEKTSLKNKITVRIYSTDGREVFSIQKNKYDYIQLNLKSLNSGLYQMHIDDGEHFINQKIIKI